MKKIIVSFIIIFMVFSMSTLCYGQQSLEEEAKVKAQLEITNSVNVNIQESKEITLKISLKELQGATEGTIISYRGTLKYDENVFSKVSVNGLNGNTATYSSSTNRIVLDPKTLKQGDDTVEIKLTISDDVNEAETKVTFELEEFTDGIEDFDIKTLTSNITIKNEKKQEIENTDKDKEKNNNKNETIEKTETPAEENKVTTTDTKDETITQKNTLPKTGYSKVFPVIVLIAITLGYIFRKQYKKIQIK